MKMYTTKWHTRKMWGFGINRSPGAVSFDFGKWAVIFDFELP